MAKKNNLHIHIYTDSEIITEKLEYMDLRNYTLQGSNLDNIKIISNIEKYILQKNPSVCKLIISDTKSLNELKNTIEDRLNLSVMHIKKYGKYKDTIINKEYEYLDITPKNVDKDYALGVLRDYLNYLQIWIL